MKRRLTFMTLQHFAYNAADSCHSVEQILTGLKGKKATAEHPCATSHFSHYNRTDVIGLISLDKYLPDKREMPESFIVADIHDGDQKAITFGAVSPDMQALCVRRRWI